MFGVFKVNVQQTLSAFGVNERKKHFEKIILHIQMNFRQKFVGD